MDSIDRNSTLTMPLQHMNLARMKFHLETIYSILLLAVANCKQTP
jgi:hypothetical protein